MKKYIPVSILLVSMLLVAGIFLYKSGQNNKIQTTATSTSEWLTYTNVAGGYSIQYPSDLQPYAYDGIAELPARPTTDTLGKIDTALSLRGTLYRTITIFVDKVSFKTPDEWIASINNKNHGYVLEIQKHVSIDGMDAAIASSLKEGNGTTYFDAFFVHDGLGYDISGSDRVASTTYDKVLSSFKFIQKN
jgi:hypothetical protein